MLQKKQKQKAMAKNLLGSGFQTFWLAPPLKRPENFRGTPMYVQKLEMDVKILQNVKLLRNL
jgi:hypothetical protein